MGVVLITRPQPGAAETAALVAARGHTSIIAPFLEIHYLHPDLPPNASACVITSANAVHAVPQNIPVFAVGDATAAKAREVTQSPVYSAAADAVALAALIAQSLTPAAGALLLLSGHGQGLTLAADLRTRGFRVIRRAAYTARPRHSFPAEALAPAITVILFFSPETARAFARLIPPLALPALAKITALTLSPAITRNLAHLPWQSIKTAEHPSQEALLKLL